MQYHIESDLCHQKGKFPNNFKTTLPQKSAAHAIDSFKDEYLLDLSILIRKMMGVYWAVNIEYIKHSILSLGKL